MKAAVERYFWPAMLGTLALGAAALAYAPSPARGQCASGGVGTSYRTNYVNTVVKKEVVAAVVVPTVATFVTIPLYTAVYVPPYAPPAPQAAPAPAVGAAAPQSESRQILELLQKMDARIKRLEGGPAVAPPLGAAAPGNGPAVVGAQAPAPGPAAGLQVLQAKCASCHEAKAAADKGGGLTLFEGPALAKLTDRQVSRVMIRVNKGTMPPKDSGLTLSDEEASAVVNAFDAK